MRSKTNLGFKTLFKVVLPLAGKDIWPSLYNNPAK
jgi:hypothetical protein